MQKLHAAVKLQKAQQVGFVHTHRQIPADGMRLLHHVSFDLHWSHGALQPQ